jgi:magnesium transporter
MAGEAEKILLQDEFEDAIGSGDDIRIHQFLDEQNISDVAELIYENEDREAYILSRRPF